MCTHIFLQGCVFGHRHGLALSARPQSYRAVISHTVEFLRTALSNALLSLKGSVLGGIVPRDVSREELPQRTVLFESVCRGTLILFFFLGSTTGLPDPQASFPGGRRGVSEDIISPA